MKAPGTRSGFLGFREHFSSRSCSRETGHSSRAQITKRGSNLINLRMDQYFCSKGPNSFENIDSTFLGFNGPVVLGYTSQGHLEQNKLEGLAVLPIDREENAMAIPVHQVTCGPHTSSGAGRGLMV